MLRQRQNPLNSGLGGAKWRIPRYRIMCGNGTDGHMMKKAEEISRMIEHVLRLLVKPDATQEISHGNTLQKSFRVSEKAIPSIYDFIAHLEHQKTPKIL